MAHQPLHAVLQHIRKVADAPHNGRQDDQELLLRFVDHQDGAAFAALVQRHGPMVRGVCWRLLRNEADADDACQATFLVLVRKGRSVRKRHSLASWLYGVAFRTALKAKALAAQRHVHEQRVAVAAAGEPWKEAAWRELCTVLDEEVQRLSEKYRAPLVLCYLQGRTRDEAAHQLGWSLRTLQRRLERAREILRLRLIRRGLTLSAGLLATALSERAAAAVLPVGLVNLTIKAAQSYAVGKTAAGLTSGTAAELAKGVLKAMFISKLTGVTTIILAIAVAGSGAGLWTYHALAAERGDNKDKKAAQPEVKGEQRDSKDKKAAPPTAERPEEPQPFLRVPSQHDGIIRVIGTEIKEGEKVPPQQTVTVKIGDEVKKYHRLKKGDQVEEGQLLARLGDELARADVAIQTAKLANAKVDKVLSEKTRDEAYQRYTTQKNLFGGDPKKGGNLPGMRATTLEDYRGALLTYQKYVEETNSRDQAIEIAIQELNKARKILEMYEIRSPSRGVIKTIYKRPGEAVKALETVFLIQVPED
jgi:RNA polymerase sigma factor (sigma-70 family)